MTQHPPIRGLVLGIERGALHDGPGVRTTVLLKGCPLRCAWCRNPESWRAVAELAFDEQKCNDCLACVANCLGGAHQEQGDRHAYDRRRCLAWGGCVESCDPGALVLYGHEMTVAEVIAIVERDAASFARTGGGLTVSGGEPLSQPAFTRELLAAAKARALLTCLDTSGEGRTEELASLLPYVDLVLFDYKATGTAKHRQLTGSDGTRILANLDRLLAQGVRIVLRTPLVAGVNDDEAHLDAIAAIFAGGGIEAVEVMPYHALGRDKRRRLGRHEGPDWPSATPEQSQGWLAALAGRGCVVRLG